jgi:hypothetical protein
MDSTGDQPKSRGYRAVILADLFNRLGPSWKKPYHPGWATHRNGLLREMKAATDHAWAEGCLHLAPGVRADCVKRYLALVRAGRAANPPPAEQERRPG